MSECKVRIELNGSLVFSLGTHKIPFAPESDPRQRCVSLGESVIKLQRLRYCCLRFLIELHWRDGTAPTIGVKQSIGGGQPAICLSIARVLFYRLVTVFNRLVEIWYGFLVIVIDRLEI